MSNRKKWGLAAFALIVVVIAAVVIPAGNKHRAPVVGTSFIMNTVVEYKLYGKNAQQAKDAIEQTLIDVENKMSMFVANSQIDQLNKQAGRQAVALTDDTFDLLSRTKAYCEQSGGVFDLTVAPLTEAWDITSPTPKIPDEQVIAQRLELVDYRDLMLDPAKKTAMLAREGQAIDVGGIAKGYACDAARRTALENGITSGYISIGGNLMVIGEKPTREPFKFGVRDPRGDSNDFVAIVTLPDSTMATSGDYERYFEQDGVRYHHILNASNGYPAQSDLMSVSVVTPDGAYADFMSTYLFVMGKEFALQNINAYDCGLILIDKDKRVYVSQVLKDSFTPSDSTGAYQFEVVS